MKWKQKIFYGYGVQIFVKVNCARTVVITVDLPVTTADDLASLVKAKWECEARTRFGKNIVVYSVQLSHRAKALRGSLTLSTAGLQNNDTVLGNIQWT